MNTFGKKFFAIILTTFLAVGSIAPSFTTNAQNQKDITGQAVTSLEITNRADESLDGQTVTTGSEVKVKVTFDDKNGKIMDGDEIVVAWPSTDTFSAEGFNSQKPLKIAKEDGTIVHVGDIVISSEGAKIIFNNNVEDFLQGSIEGNFEFFARVNNTGEYDSVATGQFIAGEKHQTINVSKDSYQPEGPYDGPIFYKTGDILPSNTDEVRWFIIMNKGQLPIYDRVTITDTLPDFGADQIFMADGFSVNITSGSERTEYSMSKFLEMTNGNFELADDKASYKLEFDGSAISGKTVEFWYKTKVLNEYAPSFTNDVTMNINTGEGLIPVSSSHTVLNIGSNAGIVGLTPRSINIQKVITGTSTPIEGVRFEVKRQDGELIKGQPSITVITDAEGKAHARGLNYGTYLVREIGAPEWVVMSDEAYEFELTVVNDIIEYQIENDIKKIDINGSKVWRDAGASTRPSEIEVILNGNGTEVARQTVTKDTDWNFTFSDLPQYNDNGMIEYTLDEVAVEGYQTVINGFEITNIRSGMTSVSGTKTWFDDNASTRPTSIEVVLYGNDVEVARQTVSNATDWSYSFQNLEKFDSVGKVITYRIDEVQVAGYETRIEGYNLINKRSDVMSISGTKTWLDDNASTRPETIEVILSGNGVEVARQTVSNDTQWAYSFESLPQFDNQGKAIVYEISETPISGYETNVDGFNLTNLRIGTVEVSGTKTWLDDNASTRPETIEVILSGNGVEVARQTVSNDTKWTYSFESLPQFDAEGKEIVYTVSETPVLGYTTSINGFNLTNLRVGTIQINGTKTWLDDNASTRPETIEVILSGNGVEVARQTVSNDTQWAYSFESLPQFDNQGKAIVYEISETPISGYETNVDGFNLTNLRIGTVEVSGTKTWLDDNASTRPETIEVILSGNGVEVARQTVSNDTKWTYSFESLPQFDAEGKAIVYAISETPIAGYETNVDGFNLTNLRVGTVEVSGTKTWLDDNASTRPETIEVILSGNGVEVARQTVSNDTKWTYSFESLPQFDNQGKAIVYAISETPIAGYETNVDGFNLTNLRIGTVEVSGTKTWLDDNASTRPETIEVILSGNGVEVARQTVSNDTQWTYSFESLPQFDNQGKAIVYAISETPIAGYETNVDGFNLTNLRIGTVEVSGTKTWLDDNASTRPETIEVILSGNGVEVARQTVSNDTQWTYSFESLPQFDNQGKAIVYAISETPIAGYETNVDGFNLTNLRVGTIDVSGMKTWVGDKAVTRPEKIQVKLLANGNVVAEQEVTEAMDWAFTFENLPEFDEKGALIMYSVDEVAVENYETTYDGFNITNTYTKPSGKTGVAGVKRPKETLPSTGVGPSYAIYLGLGLAVAGLTVLKYKKED